MNDENIKYDIDWICPVCNINTNAQGNPFFDSRSVALHIAGKILSYDYKSQHKKWLTNRMGGNVISYAKYTINTLADKIRPHVLEDYESRRKAEEEKMKHFLKQQRAIEEPGVLAYKYATYFEKRLHSFIRQILEEEFGETENEWWAKGVPLQVRTECVKRRESDPLREESYNYIDLIDLKSIVDKNWRVFEPQFKLPRDLVHTKRELLETIDHLNEIRKRIMHPTRLTVSQDDVRFLGRSYAFIEEVINFHRMQPPDWDEVLVEIQKNTKNSTSESMDLLRLFYSEGLSQWILEKFPIQHNRGLELNFISFEWREPDYSYINCLELGLTYAYSLYGRARLLIKVTGEIKEQVLYLADIPMITPSGTFIVNGLEKKAKIKHLFSIPENQGLISASLDTLVSTAIKRMSKISLEAVTPSTLVDINPFVTGINKFFSNLLKPIS